jgi:hypothetical protein
LTKKFSEEEFAKYVFPFLPPKISGRKTKLSLCQIYNHIGKVLRTGGDGTNTIAKKGAINGAT